MSFDTLQARQGVPSSMLIGFSRRGAREKCTSVAARQTLLASLIVAALAQLPAAAHATSTGRKGEVLPTVTVTAKSIPDTLDAAQIAAWGAATSDTARLLSAFAGVDTMGAGGVSSLPVIDGMADDRLHVSVNGMDVMAACANHMNPPLSYINPTAVRSIKVYPAVAPVSVGGDSLGGSIIVDSPKPEFARPGESLLSKGDIGGYYRSNGHQVGGNLSATLASANVSLWYSGSVSRSDNYTAARAFHAAGPAFAANPSVPGQSIPVLAGDEVGSTAYKAEDQQFGIAMRHGAHLLELQVDRQQIPYQGFPNQRMDMTRNDGTLVNLHYIGDYAWGSLRARLYQQDTRHEMNFGPDKQFWYGGGMMSVLAPGMPMDTHGKDSGAKLDARIDLSPDNVLKLGSSYQHYAYDEWWPPSPAVLPPGVMMGGMMGPDTFLNINDGHRNHFGSYAEWQSRWSPVLRSDLGVRFDRVSMDTGPVQGYNAMMYNGAPLFPATTFNASNRQRTDNSWSLSAIVQYAPTAGQTYSIGVAQKTRAPNLYERYTWSTSPMAMEMIGWFGDGNGYVGNLALRPEQARTVSLTADWHDPDNARWGVTLTPYYTHIDNYIDVQRCPTTVCGASASVLANATATRGFVLLQFVNQRARIYGADLSAHALLASDTALGSFTAKGTLSYVNGKNTTTGNWLYDMMPLNARLSLTQTLGHWTSTIEEELVAAKTRVSAVRNEVPTGGYALLNLRASYTWKNVRVDFGIQNALDKFYASPLGGLYLGQGATMSFGAIPWGIQVPGMGRSYYVATNVSF